MSATPFPALDPAATPALRRRFPHLGAALDPEGMRARLQRLLLDGTGVIALACARPRAEVDGDVCRLQYPLSVDGDGGPGELLVTATMFTDCAAAARHAAERLAPPASRWRALGLRGPRPMALVADMAMAVAVHPVDGEVPALVEATTPERVTAALRGLGIGSGLRAIELVRRRRDGGCVLRYVLDDGSVVFGKAGYAGAAAAVRRPLLDLAARPLASTDRTVAYPHVLGHVDELDLSLVACIPGARPDPRSDGEAVVDAAAVAAATIHGSGLRAGPRHRATDEIARGRRAVAHIAADAPALAGWLGAVLDSVSPLARAQEPALLSHGDFTPSQLLLDGRRIGIVDFDDLRRAEPAYDLGRFVAYLDAALPLSDGDRGDALTARLLASYRTLSGGPVSVERVDLYAVTSLVQMAAHRCRQLKASRLRTACALLERRAARVAAVPHAPAA